MTDQAQVVAVRLREAREVTGLTQGDVATTLGLPRTSVLAMEAGTRKVSVTEITALAKLYGRTVAWLVGEEDSPDLSGQALYRATKHLTDTDRDQILKFAQFLAASHERPGREP